MKIFKYEIEAADVTAIEMPAGAEILTVQVQHDTPCIWVKVDPDAPMVTRCIRMVGTGHEMNGAESLPYIGTFQVAGGSLIFHLFDAGEEAPADRGEV